MYKEQKLLLNSLYGGYIETEHNLTLQEILNSGVIGKYYKSDDDMIWQLHQNDFCDLEMVLIEDLDLIYTPYTIMQECYTLEEIVNTMYKEVIYEW